MIASFILFVENNFVILFFVHIALSLIMAEFLSDFTKKRFVKNTKKVREQDEVRVQIVEQESAIFKLFFEVSLHKHNAITSRVFLFFFNFTIPLFGIFTSTWIMYYLMNITYSKKVENTNILNLDEFGMGFLKVERMFGEGSMSDLMTNTHAPKSKKLMALSSLSANLSPANLKIIKNTLFSTDDEIRMFGYAIINKAEQKLSAKMNLYLDIFNAENEKKEEDRDKEKLAHSAKELGFLYWEMVYIELAHDSLKDNFLEEVIKYIAIAKEFYEDGVNRVYENVLRYELKLQERKDDEEQDKIKYQQAFDRLALEKREYDNYNNIATRLYVLMGRVYMYQKKFKKAANEFIIAQEIDTAEASFVLPYLAEVNFLLGNYQKVHQIMKQAKDLEFNATLYPIAQQWKVS